MAQQVNNSQSNAQANPNSIRGSRQDSNPQREPSPVNKKIDGNSKVQQEDRVDIGKPTLTKRNVTEASRIVDSSHEKQVKKENPPLPSPPQNTANINLSTRQEPQDSRAPKVDSHSIRTTIEVTAEHRNAPTVVEQQIKTARTAGSRPKPNPGQAESQQSEAKANVQVKREQGQKATETELRRSPAAVQTQKGQNVDKLT